MQSILSTTSQLLLLLNIFLFFKGFSNLEKPLKIFTIYLLIMFVIDITVSVLNYSSINNLFLSHFYFVIQFLFLSFFYFTLFKVVIQKKIIVAGFFLVLISLGIQYFYDPGLFFKFNLFEIFITSFLIIIYGTFHLYNILSEKKYIYYITIGIIFYIFSSTVVFFMGNMLAVFKIKGSSNIYLLNSLMYVVFQLFILYEYYTSIYKNLTKKTNE